MARCAALAAAATLGWCAGLRFAASSAWSAYVSFGVPIVQHIRLSHPERDYRVISGISWSLGR